MESKRPNSRLRVWDTNIDARSNRGACPLTKSQVHSFTSLASSALATEPWPQIEGNSASTHTHPQHELQGVGNDAYHVDFALEHDAQRAEDVAGSVDADEEERNAADAAVLIDVDVMPADAESQE